ncbi:hypothetical protein [Vulgatibacter incomptus]|uniref:Uncharacterized protein n=1 Tax=Vulgatibacter incomptus TaxID=1391653 RepID=A0A0K1PE67_9BACT|nr:hypothetical protein [Vulgatibacter incomptus]AKU91810.1 hypothetical protein AKJ08_2197 [Vulgatibacter incomptus]
MRANLSILIAAAVLAAPLASSAETPASLLEEARATITAMKQSTSQVRQLATEQAKGSDKLKLNCVTERRDSMEQSVARAEATLDAANGWGLDVATAALQAVKSASQQVKLQRAEANRCVGIEDGAVLADSDEKAGGTDASTDALAAKGSREDGTGWYNPLSDSATSPFGSVPLQRRLPAASPTK